MYPKIEQDVVDTEVFSLVRESPDAKVSAQGVVYCEMKARQHGEGDLMDLNLRREFANKHQKSVPALKLFQWECGGLTNEIVYLSRQEILEFHRAFYRPEKITVFLCGNDWNEQALAEALSIIDSSIKTECPPSSSFEDAADLISKVADAAEYQPGRVCTVDFPTEDENAGSVGFAWPGAPAQDLERVLCFHILFKYLRETSSSPLQQAFVQIAEPWATEIDYEIKPHLLTIMTLIFSGVDVGRGGLKPHVIKNLLMSCLASCMEDESKFFQNIMLILKSFELKLVELFEDDPHETVLSYSIPNVIRIELGDEDIVPFGSNIVTLKDTLHRISSQAAGFWVDLIRELISVEPVQVILTPNSKLNALIEADEQMLISKLTSTNDARIVDKVSVATVEVSLDDHLLCPGSVPFCYRITADNISVTELPSTGLKGFTRLTNFTNIIPHDLWVYLPLLQELLFQCDLDVSGETGQNFLHLLGCPSISEGTLSYQQLQRLMNSRLNTFSSAFGMDNEIFSIGYCEQAMLATVHLPATSRLSLDDCWFIIDFIWERSVFTEERIIVIAENLINQIRDLQKDPYEVMDALLTKALNSQSASGPKKARVQVHSFEQEISIFRQRTFLRGLVKNIANSDIMKRLDTIRGCLLSRTFPSFLHISGPPLVLENEIDIFKSTEKRFFSAMDILPLNSLPKYGDLSLSTGRAIGLARGDFTASYLSVVIPCNVLPTDGSALMDEIIEDYVAIMLICQLLSVTEGPIYRRIRGRGLAYDAGLTLSLWNGLLTLSVNDSVNPVDAFKELMGLMQEIDAELSGGKGPVIFSESALRVAKSAVLFQLTEERSAPSSLATVACRLLLRGIQLPEDNTCSDPVKEACVACTPANIRRAWSKHFVPLLEPAANAIVTLAVPSGSTHFFTEFEAAIGMAVDQVELSDMFDGSPDCSESESDGSGSEEPSDTESEESE